MGLGKVKYHYHHIISRVHTINMTSTLDVDLDHLPEVVFVSFLHHKVTLSPLSILCSLEGSQYTQPTFKEWGFILP